MHRPRFLWCLLLAPVLLALVVTAPGCGGAAEQPLVRQFFQASRLSDTMTLGNIATVSFDPKKDGSVEGFSIVSVSEEQSRPLQLIEFAKELQQAQAVDQEFSKKKKEYQDANGEAIERILKIEAKSGKVTGKDAAVQTEWNTWREQTKEHSKVVSEARAKLNAERRVADLSIADRDVTQFTGTEFTKDVTVSANVRMPDNSTAKKTLVLTMQRVILKDEKGQDIPGKWMFTKIEEKQ
jgi:hypothetical protein